MLAINAQAYSVEAGNARHEHEWQLWQDVKLPDGKVILPGVVSHATNVVEHPELVADRIVRFARLVGRERVIAATDCGLGGRVHADIAWASLEALAQGAAIATRQLWSCSDRARRWCWASGPRSVGRRTSRWISLVSLVLVKASINRMRAFCGFNVSETTKSNSSSLASPLRATMPLPTRLERDDDHAVLARFDERRLDCSAKLPSPTPA